MKKIIVTVGPALFAEKKLCAVHSEHNIYRVNGAHGNVNDIKASVEKIRALLPDAEILIDLPGNKIRTKNFTKALRVKKGETFVLESSNLNYSEFGKYVKKGDIAFADDSTLKFEVKNVKAGAITFISHSDGELKNNKGVHIAGACESIPFLFEKDHEIIKVVNELKLTYIGLSFVRNTKDIEMARLMIDENVTTIIAKVETREAVNNVNQILQNVEHILIDRGDLSTEIGLLRVPACQKYIIERALFWNKKVFLATQFLKNMVEKPIPTIAEIIDLHNTFKLGVYGIQLSEETAIGLYPEESVALVYQILDELAIEMQSH